METVGYLHGDTLNLGMCCRLPVGLIKKNADILKLNARSVAYTLFPEQADVPSTRTEDEHLAPFDRITRLRH